MLKYNAPATKASPSLSSVGSDALAPKYLSSKLSKAASAAAASATLDGRITVDYCDVASNNREWCVNIDDETIVGANNVTTGAINNIQFSFAAGNFDGGTITLIGHN